MRKVFALTILLSASMLGACNGGRAQITRVRYGMDQDDVYRAMGRADREENDAEDPHRSIWVYNTEGEHCTVTFFDQRVFERPRCQSPDRLQEIADIEKVRSNYWLWEDEQKRQEARYARIRAEREEKTHWKRRLATESVRREYTMIPTKSGAAMIEREVPVAETEKSQPARRDDPASERLEQQEQWEEKALSDRAAENDAWYDKNGPMKVMNKTKPAAPADAPPPATREPGATAVAAAAINNAAQERAAADAQAAAAKQAADAQAAASAPPPSNSIQGSDVAAPPTIGN